MFARQLLVASTTGGPTFTEFQKVSELFTMGPYCSSTPNRILFHAAWGPMLSNTFTVLQTLLAAERPRQVESVSMRKVFEEL